MKKAGSFLLALVILLSLGSMVGIFLLRNAPREPVTLRDLPRAATSPPVTVTVPATTEPVATDAPVVYPLDLNTADLDALMTLPGIGPVLGQRILDYRQATGGFTSVEELLEIDGIGQKRLEAIRDYLTIGGSS